MEWFDIFIGDVFIDLFKSVKFKHAINYWWKDTADNRHIKQTIVSSWNTLAVFKHFGAARTIEIDKFAIIIGFTH